MNDHPLNRELDDMPDDVITAVYEFRRIIREFPHCTTIAGCPVLGWPAHGGNPVWLAAAEWMDWHGLAVLKQDPPGCFDLYAPAGPRGAR